MSSAFADKDENPELPGSDWDLNFSEQKRPDSGRLTRVSIIIKNESLDRLEKLIDGFREGFTTTLNNLDSLLATLSHGS